MERFSSPRRRGLISTRALGLAFASSFVGTGVGLAAGAGVASAAVVSTYCRRQSRPPHATCKTGMSASVLINDGLGDQWICVDTEYGSRGQYYTGQTCRLGHPGHSVYATSSYGLFGRARAWNGDNTLSELFGANWEYSH
jgi:hypothetical protein